MQSLIHCKINPTNMPFDSESGSASYIQIANCITQKPIKSCAEAMIFHLIAKLHLITVHCFIFTDETRTVKQYS